MSVCHCLCQVRAEICSKEEVEEEEMEAAVSSAKRSVTPYYVSLSNPHNKISSLENLFYRKESLNCI